MLELDKPELTVKSTTNAPSKLRSLFVTISIASSALISQILLWRNADIADFSFWVEKMEDLRVHIQNFDFIFSSPPSHFGTLITLVGIFFRQLGMSPEISLKASIIVLCTLIITFMAVLTYHISPKSFLYIWVITPFIFNKYIASNPLDIIHSALLCTLYIIIFYQCNQDKKNTKLLFVAGIIFGLSAATRIHTTILLGLPALFYLLPTIGWKRLLIPMLTGIAIFLALTPYLWHSPRSAVEKAVTRIVPYYQEKTEYLVIKPTYQLNLKALILQAPLATLSFVVILFSFGMRRFQFNKHQKIFYMFIIILSIIMVVTIMKSHIPQIRFLYPVIFILEIFMFPVVEPYFYNFSKVLPNKKSFLFAIMAFLLISNSIIIATLLAAFFHFNYLPARFFLAAMEIETLSLICLLSTLRPNNYLRNFFLPIHEKH